MKNIFVVVLVFLSCTLIAQEMDVSYFAKNGMFLKNDNKASLKVVRHQVSKKKFELIEHGKFGNQWRQIGSKRIITKKKDNFFSVENIFRGQSVRSSKIEIIDTIGSHFLIKEYEGDFVSEVMVSSVFPLVMDGACKFLNKKKNAEPKVEFFYKNLKFLPVMQPEVEGVYSGNLTAVISEDLPSYPGGINQFLNDLIEKTRFPGECTIDDLKGQFLLSMTIDKSGEIKGEQFVQVGSKKVGDAMLEAISKINKPWRPAMSESVAIDYSYIIPISLAAEDKKEDTKVLKMVDKMPEFLGGESGLRKFIAANINYPEEVRREGVEGKVYVDFIIDTNGNVGSVKVIRSVHPLLDEEAKRVVKSLPKWIPGEHGGKRVCVSYTVPINFVLTTGHSVLERSSSRRGFGN